MKPEDFADRKHVGHGVLRAPTLNDHAQKYISQLTPPALIRLFIIRLGFILSTFAVLGILTTPGEASIFKRLLGMLKPNGSDRPYSYTQVARNPEMASSQDSSDSDDDERYPRSPHGPSEFKDVDDVSENPPVGNGGSGSKRPETLIDLESNERACEDSVTEFQ